MAEEGFKRKLTAILSADVAGYSRLMGDNEFATVSTLKSYRELIFEKVQAFNGRVVDSPGDNILSEFRSIVDAVSCAVAIQEGLRVQNEKLPENRKMNFRIGVNLGDVIQDGNRIYGDGVPDGTLQGLNDWKRTGYGGPCPPIGQHRYFFKLYALNIILSDLKHPTTAILKSAMKGHILDTAELIGLYQRK